jgi:hypothetical protein
VVKADGQKLLGIAAGVEEQRGRGCAKRSGSTFTGERRRSGPIGGGGQGRQEHAAQAPWRTVEMRWGKPRRSLAHGRETARRDSGCDERRCECSARQCAV